MRKVVEQLRTQTLTVHEFANQMLVEATAIHDEDRSMCHAIGRFGARRSLPTMAPI